LRLDHQPENVTQANSHWRPRHGAQIPAAWQAGVGRNSGALPGLTPTAAPFVGDPHGVADHVEDGHGNRSKDPA